MMCKIFIFFALFLFIFILIGIILNLQSVHAPPIGGPKDSGQGSIKSPNIKSKFSAPKDLYSKDFLSSKDFYNKPLDLNNLTTSPFTLTSVLIAKDIKKIDVDYIKEYPIIDLYEDELKLVLELLEPRDLNKLLLNIPIDDLNYIYQRISPSEFKKILDNTKKRYNGFMLTETLIENRIENMTKSFRLIN